MTNIIFGLYNGYNSLKTHKGGLYYFMKSLRKYNTQCKVIVVCEKQNIFEDLIEFSKTTNFVIYSDFETTDSPMMYYRFNVYKKYLDESEDDFKQILLSDLDDVIFQEDPFDISFKEELYCAMEHNILSDTYNWAPRLNMEWIRACNHLQINYANFDNKHIVCAGTILGTSNGIKKYLDFFIEAQRKEIINDQGLLNIYVYNYLESKAMVEVRKSKILTLEGLYFENLNIESNSIINDDGEKYSIIHQINRCNQSFMLDLV
jgi:hypothetical protein